MRCGSRCGQRRGQDCETTGERQHVRSNPVTPEHHTPSAGQFFFATSAPWSGRLAQTLICCRRGFRKSAQWEKTRRCVDRAVIRWSQRGVFFSLSSFSPGAVSHISRPLPRLPRARLPRVRHRSSAFVMFLTLDRQWRSVPVSRRRNRRHPAHRARPVRQRSRPR